MPLIFLYQTCSWECAKIKTSSSNEFAYLFIKSSSTLCICSSILFGEPWTTLILTPSNSKFRFTGNLKIKDFLAKYKFTYLVLSDSDVMFYKEEELIDYKLVYSEKNYKIYIRK